MQKVTFKIESFDDGRTYAKTTVECETGDKLQDVLLTVVKGLLGHSYSEELIKDYMNYNRENWCVDKIGEM